MQVHSHSHLRHRVLQPHLLAARPHHDHALLQGLPGGQATHDQHEAEAVQPPRHVLLLRHPEHLQHRSVTTLPLLLTERRIFFPETRREGGRSFGEFVREEILMCRF